MATGGSGNLLISPISLSTNLRLLLLGTRGDTRKTLGTTLQLGSTSDSELLSGSHQLAVDLAGAKDAQTTIANSLWLAPNLTLAPRFAKLASESFEAYSATLAGTGKTGADQINSWVNDHTKQRISQLFTTIPADAALVLVNAVTFDGKWQDPFAWNDTTPRPFFGITGHQDVLTMSRIGMIDVAKVSKTQFIRLPYVGHTSMWIALPPIGTGPDTLLEKFGHLPDVSSQRVKIDLPKFSFRNEFQLQGPLTKLGMGALFVRGNFKGISPDPRLGKVSEIVHKTFIDVDEEGTRAAAATGSMIRPTAIFRQPDLTEIKVDHPFAMAIRDDTTGTLLFVGVVRNLK
jgi:serpin B